jgi:hypothetical protein
MPKYRMPPKAAVSTAINIQTNISGKLADKLLGCCKLEIWLEGFIRDI